jgi:hypothetical protein
LRISGALGWRGEIGCRFSWRRSAGQQSPAQWETGQFGLQLEQRILQGLLDDRVIEGHFEGALDGHPVLDGPADQVGEVLAAGTYNGGAEKAVAAAIGVEAEHAAVLAHDHRAPDGAKALLGDREALWVEGVPLAADAGDVGLREYDGQVRARRIPALAAVGGVPAGDAALLGGAAQVGDAAGGVAGEVDRGAVDLEGGGVMGRHASGIERRAEPLEVQPREVRLATDGQEQLLDPHRVLAGAHQEAALATLDLRFLAEHERELTAEDLDGGPVDRRIFDPRDALAVVEAGHLDAEALQRLADLDTDRAQADDRDRCGRRIPARARAG